MRCSDSHSNSIISPFSNRTITEWIHCTNASGLCPTNKFITGLQVTPYGGVMIACNVLPHGYQLDTQMCHYQQPIPSPHTNQSLTALKPLVVTSLYHTQRWIIIIIIALVLIIMSIYTLCSEEEWRVASCPLQRSET